MPSRAQLARLRSIFLRADPALYALWSAALTIASAHLFYAYMLKQTRGEWSAPLDDVFIHFDYARATARGHPFEWVEGNGYSSGNTSLAYPFVLAIGYAIGFRELSLMKWAALVAGVSVFATLLIARRFFVLDRRDRVDVTSRALSYLLAPIALGVGAVDWSLWSGMEVAVFLATWAIAARAYFALEAARDPRRRARRAWLLGACGALMITTRPESVTTIAAFGLFACALRFRRGAWRAPLFDLLRVAAPGALVLVAQSIANRIFTGEWSANGALVKLAINNPYFSTDAKLDDYVFNFKYGILRNVEYHFTDDKHYGVILPALACCALAAPRTRKLAALLWTQVASWMAIVALNGQVRWQNERYVMPAVAWLLVLAAMGVASLVRRDRGARPTLVVTTILFAFVAQLEGVVMRHEGVPPVMQLSWLVALPIGLAAAIVLRWWPARVVIAIAALAVAQDHQAPRMRDQKWFFGRASRNIFDQHVTTGRLLREGFDVERDDRRVHVTPRRVLVGDAGAIVYAADMPGLDIIGLGGFHDFPFARAGVNGLASTIELMEYMSPRDRPDVMAIYPSWWGVLPLWFGGRVLARVPAEGNVICGAYEDVVYEADWSLLGTGEAPREAPQGEAIRDSVDVADVLSEKRHGYAFTHPENGWTELEVLADPEDPSRGLLDGGRRISPGKEERFAITHLDPHADAHLVIRSAPDGKARVRVVVEGNEVATIALAPAGGWIERAIPIPASAIREGSTRVTLVSDGPDDFVDYHVWATQ